MGERARQAMFISLDLASPCWLWPGRLDRDGYGRWSGHAAHRELWERLFGEMPDDVPLDHGCNNRACVNPAHMQPLSTAENLRRRLVQPVPPGSDPDRWAERCRNGHDRTKANTRRAADGSRDCLDCRADRQVRQTQRRRADALEAS